MDKLLGRESFDLIVLDLMMPGEDGLSVCRRLRGAREAIPIIMLTAKGDDVDRIVGLEMGADDYLPKPFNPRELVARIHAVLRRRSAPPPPGAPALEEGQVSFGQVSIDLATRALTRAGKTISLTTGEFGLLKVLLAHPRVPLSRDKLMETRARARIRSVRSRHRCADLAAAQAGRARPGASRAHPDCLGIWLRVRSGRQGRPMSFAPRTLLWRSFLLISLLMVISAVAWFQILRSYEREPRARQLAQTVVSVVNLTRAALVTAKADKRRELLAELGARRHTRLCGRSGRKTDSFARRALCAPVACGSPAQARRGHALRLRRGRAARFFHQFSHRRRRVLGDAAARAHGAAVSLAMAGLDRTCAVPVPGRRLDDRIAHQPPAQSAAAAAGDIGQGRTPAPLPESGPAGNPDPGALVQSHVAGSRSPRCRSRPDPRRRVA